MINLSWETVAGQLDMPLAGRLVLSAAAAAFLLALAFRLYKSRTLSKSEPLRTESPALNGITNNEKNDTQNKPTRGVTDPISVLIPGRAIDQAPEVRHRNVTRIVLSQNTKKNNSQTNLESHRPSREGHERESRASITEDLPASQVGDPQFASSNEQSVTDGQARTDITSSKPHDAVQDREQEKSGSGGNQKLYDQVNTQPASNLPEQQEEVTEPSAPVSSQSPPAGKQDKDHEENPNFDDAVLYLASTLDMDTRKEPDGGEINSSLLNIRGTEAPRDRVRKIKARSGLDLTIDQNHDGASGVYSSFSSIAEVGMEESLIKRNSDKSDRPTKLKTPAVLKSKVYNYYVEHTSESRSKDRSFSSRPVGTRSPLLHSEDRKDQLKSTRLHPIQNQGLQNSMETNALRDELSPATNDSPDCGILEAVLPARDSSQPHKDYLAPKEDLMKTENTRLQQAMPTPSSSVNSSSSGITNHQDRLIPDSASPMLKYSDPIHCKPKTTANSVPASAFHNLHDFQILQRHKDSVLNLSNCYSALKIAKEQHLDDLKEAAYKFMSDNYLQVLQSPAIYGHLNATERELILDKRMKGRRYMTVADVNTLTHASPSSRSSSILCYYDSEGGTWHRVSCLPPEAVTTGCAMSTMFNYLFIVAGCEGPARQRKPSKRVFCYNPLNGDWKEICPLNQARPHCKLVELKGYLYAIGGECQHTMEQYDPRRDRWSFATSLPNDTFAIAHMATVCEDKIYVTGGTLRYMLLTYEPREQLWRSNLISGSRDRTTELVAVGSFLYRFDLNRNTGISVHRCNVRARLWYECASHRVPYPASFQCAVIGNHIHCMSRQFHLRFLADDISPRFLDGALEGFPSPAGALFPFVLVLPDDKVLPPEA